MFSPDRGSRAMLRSLVVLLTTVLLLAGCGSGSTGNQGVTATAAAAEVAATPTPAPPLGATPPTSPARAVPYQAPGMTYNGLHSTTNPTADQITSDLALVKSKGFNTIRTYYPQYVGSIDVDAIAKAQGLQVVLGLYIFDNPQWIEDNYNQFVKPAVARGNVVAVLVGNEDPQHLDTIIKYLQRLKADFPTLPVSTAQKTDFWLHDSNAAKVLPYVTFIAANIYPSWDWQAPVAYQPAIGGTPVTPAAGFATFTSTYGQIQAKYSAMQVVVTETGWPTTYGWVVDTTPPPQPAAGIANAKAYLDQVIAWAGQNQVNVYMYSMFDDIYAVDASSQFNLHFGLVDWKGVAKGILF